MNAQNPSSIPSGFRTALLARLRNRAAAEGLAVQRLQQRVAFERLLARLAPVGDWVLKGGFALELRYGWTSRPTKDLDLRTSTVLEVSLERLRASLATSEIDDHFSFELGPTVVEMQGAPGGTVTVPVTARVAGAVFVQFRVDLSSSDVIVGDADELVGSNLLLFAGIAPIRFPVYPLAQQLAEKLHAYTLPRTAENTRVKDLVDLVSIAKSDSIAGDQLLASVRATFAARATHDPPAALPAPPTSWGVAFRELSSAIGITVSTVDEGYEVAGRFWNPVLAGGVGGQSWDPDEQGWHNDSEK
jgi:predicted nucleotidyltransferase component of viral defense system